MVSISQDNNTFYYIHWVPSESGPLILNYGKEIIKMKSNYNQIFYDVLDEIRIKTGMDNFIYSITLDSRMVFFSETYIDDKFDHFDIIDWFHHKTIGKIQNGLDETYHYSFSSNQKKYLNVHFKSDIKKKMRLFAQDTDSEIRNIGLGIFSAEVAARCIMNADYNASYAILKVGKNNEVLIIKDNELVSYFKFKIQNKKYVLIENYGDINLTKKTLKEIELIINNKNKKIKLLDHLYFYQGKGKYSIIDKLLLHNKSNITPINIFSQLKFSGKKVINDHDSLLYAETGSSLWGIDV